MQPRPERPRDVVIELVKAMRPWGYTRTRLVHEVEARCMYRHGVIVDAVNGLLARGVLVEKVQPLARGRKKRVALAGTPDLEPTVSRTRARNEATDVGEENERGRVLRVGSWV